MTIDAFATDSLLVLISRHSATIPRWVGKCMAPCSFPSTDLVKSPTKRLLDSAPLGSRRGDVDSEEVPCSPGFEDHTVRSEWL